LLALDADLPDRTRKGLAQIDKAARRMNEMIQTALDFTRTRLHGELTISRRPMSLHELCQATIDDALATALSATIRLTADGDVTGNWDQTRLGQVIANLVDNAIVHGDRATPIEVAITEESIAGDPVQVSLVVSNRGPTIEAADRLFEPFVQGEHCGKGLGLGLYIARHVARAHGGTLDCISHDNATTFTLRLPRA
jgi:signal transduction histidine kinase